MVDRQRERALNVRISEDEERMLKALSSHHGLSVSDIVRQAIRRAFAEAFPPRRPKK